MFPFRRRSQAPGEPPAERQSSDAPQEPPAPPLEPTPRRELTEEQVLDAGPAVDWGGDPSRLSG
jgi:hypothetical protein